MDPVTFTKLWLTVQPAKRLKLALAKRKLRKASAAGEMPNVFEIEEDAEVNYQQIEGIVRHTLTFVGGLAVGAGYMTEAEAIALVGALTAIAGVAHSIWQKKNKKP